MFYSGSFVCVFKLTIRFVGSEAFHSPRNWTEYIMNYKFKLVTNNECNWISLKYFSTNNKKQQENQKPILYLEMCKGKSIEKKNIEYFQKRTVNGYVPFELGKNWENEWCVAGTCVRVWIVMYDFCCFQKREKKNSWTDYRTFYQCALRLNCYTQRPQVPNPGWVVLYCWLLTSFCYIDRCIYCT